MTTFTEAEPMFAYANRAGQTEEGHRMPMPQKAARWTLAELHRLPDDGNKYELVRGDLFVTPPPSPEHEEIASILARVLHRYVETHALGRVYHPRSVIRVLRSEVEPDLMVRPRVPRPPRSWSRAPLPILVVEILSDGTRRRDRIQKRSLYLDAGIPEYWLVDGEERTIRVATDRGEDLVCDDELRWQPAGAAEPLIIDVRALFEDVGGKN
jgi:Uma2 family endonuclease